MAQTGTITIQLPEESMNRLDVLAKETSHTRADIAVQAVLQYLDVHDWQVQAIEDAVRMADSPSARFLDHEEVVSRFKKAGKL